MKYVVWAAATIFVITLAVMLYLDWEVEGPNCVFESFSPVTCIIQERK